ncbi:MAG: methyltransferase domain-containing protein [Myxococcales bacterium]|nr:methyltransferase domain-containing protein [Myxococcales bacterium]
MSQGPETSEPGFADHFSAGAADYARFRPRYPDALFDHLAALAPGRERAWECATGNGQAALALAERFEEVVATDASAEQLAEAPAHPRVRYRCERAEQSSLEAGSVDLVTIAAALHWFDRSAFFAEVRRVARPGALFAAWSYGAVVRASPAIDAVVERYAHEVLADHWPPEFHHIRTTYREIELPFAEVAMPELAIEVEWGPGDLLGWLETWSGAAAFRRREGRAPTRAIHEALARAWGDPARAREIRLPIFFRVGRVGG